MRAVTVKFPKRDSGLGVESLAREMQSIANASLKPPPFPDGPFPRGEGHAVLVIPGFLAGDWTTQRLRDFLRTLDYRVETADILLNAGPTRGLMEKLETRLANLAAGERGPVSLVGVSLGGVLARHLARHHTRHVRCVVTLGSPIRFPVVTPLQPLAVALAPFHEPEWVARREEIAASLNVPVTALYSEEDGIVDWRQCLQDDAPGCANVRIYGSHMAMGSNPQAQRAVALALAAR